MNDADRLARLDYFGRLAVRAPTPPPGPTPTPETKLAARERRVLEDALAQTRRTLTALERRGEHRGAQMARRSVRRLELEVLNARARAAGLSVPAAREERGPGLRERATFE